MFSNYLKFFELFLKYLRVSFYESLLPHVWFDLRIAFYDSHSHKWITFHDSIFFFPPFSELEAARPQTVGEEELQLQLALAMSKEEAEQEEQKQRSDDVRLQMAITQSEEDFKWVLLFCGQRNNLID